MERVFECVAAAALPGKRIAVATTDNGTNSMIKGMRDGGVIRWPCAAVHMLNRVIKNTLKRVNNNNSVYLLPKGFVGSAMFNPALQKEMEERGIKKINDYPETRRGCIYMCQGHLREEMEQAV